MKRRSRKVNYLSNKELLKEIHRSKLSYCEFDDPKYQDYDLIIEPDQKITKDIVKQAKENRAERLNEIEGDKLFAQGWTNKQILHHFKEGNGLSSKDIAKEDVVIRIMTNDHIPDTTNKKGETVKVKVNFPAFQHFSFVDGSWKCVGKSHWHNGKFSKSHGKTNNKLASAFIKLVNRYGSRGNWRGYTWIEEMKGQALVRLCQVALQFNEAKSQNPFAWYTTVIQRSFTHVLNTEKDKLKFQQSILKESGMAPNFNEQAESEINSYYKDKPDSETPSHILDKK